MNGFVDPIRLCYHKPPEDSQVTGVKIHAVLDSLGCLQDHRQVTEAMIIDQATERFPPQFPRAYTGVSVHAAAAFATTVIQMPDPQTVDSNRALK
jgi:hypothetical protein